MRMSVHPDLNQYIHDILMNTIPFLESVYTFIYY